MLQVGVSLVTMEDTEEVTMSEYARCVLELERAEQAAYMCESRQSRTVADSRLCFAMLPEIVQKIATNTEQS